MINKRIYEYRFEDLKIRNRIWEILTKNFFQQFINKNSSILDFGCGYCEFINNIKCKTKYAYDIDISFKEYTNKDIKFITKNNFPQNLDRIFISNVFEHMERKDISDTIKLFYKSLKKNGQVLVLQPNIRFTQDNYWKFFDHITPIDDRALEEIFGVFNFKLKKRILRFLPFQTKSIFPKHSIFIKIYLLFPPLWYLFGKQTFLIFEK